jgi:hypothetical protein
MAIVTLSSFALMMEIARIKRLLSQGALARLLFFFFLL